MEKNSDSLHNHAALFDSIVQQEAMLIDIPIPLYDQRIIERVDKKIEPDTLVFGYESPLTVDQVVSFFMLQMERYGWRHLVTFEGAQLILQFESPDRYCTVTIKKNGDVLAGSTIFLYIKKASPEARL